MPYVQRREFSGVSAHELSIAGWPHGRANDARLPQTAWSGERLLGESLLLGEAAKHEDRSGLADLEYEYLRRRGGAICRNGDAAILDVEEDAERGAEVNHPGHRHELLAFGQSAIAYPL